MEGVILLRLNMNPHRLQKEGPPQDLRQPTSLIVFLDPGLQAQCFFKPFVYLVPVNYIPES